MVAGVIIGIAAEDIEGQTGEEFAQSLPGMGEAMPNDLGEGFVTGVSRHHLI